MGLSPKSNACSGVKRNVVQTVYQSQIKSVCFLLHVSPCQHTGRSAREDRSGSVSAQLVAKVSAVEQRTADTDRG
jgi:hypothetical protein